MSRILLRWGAAVAAVLLGVAWVPEIAGVGEFAPISSAFAKKKGKSNPGKIGGSKKGKQLGKVGSGNKVDAAGDEAETTDDGPENPSEVIDFHDEGFSSGRRTDIKLRREPEPDFLDRRHKVEVDDNLGLGDKLDLKAFKHNLHEGLGLNDEVDPKLLKNGLGDIEQYVKPLEADLSSKGERNSGEEHPAHIKEVSGHGKDANISEERRNAKELGLDDELAPKALGKALDAQDYTNLLKTSSQEDVRNSDAEKGAPQSAGQNAVPEKERAHNADNAGKGNTAKNQTLSPEQQQQLQALQVKKDEINSEIAALKDERKAADTKEEKKELKAEIKDLREELKTVKQEMKAVKTDSETEIAADQQDQSGGTDVEPVRAETFASREVLALGLSITGGERVRALGFQFSESTIEFGGTTLRTLYVPERMDALQALRLLRRELPTESFHLNRLYRPYSPSKSDRAEDQQRDPRPGGKDCLGDKCYSRAVIRWSDYLTACTSDVSIGVIDTDVDLKHPTFAGRKISHRTFLSEGKTTASNWHGTGILALLAGRPDSNTPGLIPEARFFVANSFFSDGNGEAVSDTVSLLRSLEWMAASGARVINMSFTGPDDVLVQGRIKVMRSKGFVFTAAAGNDGPAAPPNYPAAYPEVIAVTAVSKDLRIYPSANRGQYVDVSAPGVRIWTALPNGGEGYRTGTSFAAPFATAVLALQRPEIPYEPEEKLLDNLQTVPLGPGDRNPIYGRGLLQAPSKCPSPENTASSRTAQTRALQR